MPVSKAVVEARPEGRAAAYARPALIARAQHESGYRSEAVADVVEQPHAGVVAQREARDFDARAHRHAWMRTESEAQAGRSAERGHALD